MTVTTNNYYIGQQTNITGDTPHVVQQHATDPASVEPPTTPTIPQPFSIGRKTAALLIAVVLGAIGTLSTALLNETASSFVHRYLPAEAWDRIGAFLTSPAPAPAPSEPTTPAAVPPAPLPKPKPTSSHSLPAQSPKPETAPRPRPTVPFRYPATLYRSKQAKLIYQLNALLTLHSSHTCTFTVEQHGIQEGPYTLDADGKRVHVPLNGGYLTVQRVEHDCTFRVNCSCTLALSGQFSGIISP